MIEKFSDYEGTNYIDQEGDFTFEVTNAELTMSNSGNQMVKFTVKAPEGTSLLFFSLSPKARWKYNSFIKACLNMDNAGAARFELDYETFHNELIGKRFIGTVIHDYYTSTKKVLTPDGRFVETEVEKDTYKIDKFAPVIF